ncbi:MAG: hypothetical protein F6K48_28700 [Okeania sp. SIO3H1]|nr:hypothetical protein [Okeania sp. SIO3H1]
MRKKISEDEIRHKLLDTRKQFEELYDQARRENTLKDESTKKELIKLDIMREALEYQLSLCLELKAKNMLEEVSLEDLKQVIENRPSISINENYGVAHNEGDINNYAQTVTGNSNQTAQGNEGIFNHNLETDKQITPTEVVEMLNKLE